jgi:hypothetical protein
MVRYFVLRRKSNREIQAKLSLVQDKDALYHHNVETLIARYQSWRTDAESEE